MLFFGVVTITNLKLEICGEIPTEIPVSFWQLCELCRTIKQPHTIVLLILNAKNDLEDVILLKNHEAPSLHSQPAAFGSLLQLHKWPKLPVCLLCIHLPELGSLKLAT